MELILICGLLIMLGINIAWFVTLGEAVKGMETMSKIITTNADLTKLMAEEMIKDKTKEIQELKNKLN